MSGNSIIQRRKKQTKKNNNENIQNTSILNYLKTPFSEITRQTTNTTNVLLCRENSEPPTELWGNPVGGSVLGSREWNASTRFFIKHFTSSKKDEFKFLGDRGLITPFVCSFSHFVRDGKYLAVADEEGVVGFIDARHDNTIEMERYRPQFRTHDNAVFDIMWSENDKSIITASGDQTARLWDIESHKCKAVFFGHTCSIKTVSYNSCNPNMLVTASRDGNIFIWDVRTTGLRMPEGGSVTGAQFLKHQDNLISSTGAIDGIIKYWDLRNHGTIKSSTPVQTSINGSNAKRPHGISNLLLNNKGNRLFTSSTDNVVYMYDPINLGAPLARFTSPTFLCCSFYIRMAISPDDKYIMCGSGDNNIYIWEIDFPDESPVILKAHEDEVTSLSWSRNLET
ncbi:11889_t:CDS:10, partial [Diversispora eburnea]